MNAPAKHPASAAPSRVLARRGLAALALGLLALLLIPTRPVSAQSEKAQPAADAVSASQETESQETGSQETETQAVQTHQRVRDRLLLGNGMFPSAASSLPGIQRGRGTRADLYAPPIDDLIAANRQRDYYRSVLGESRWRDLERARFDLDLMELDPTYGWNSELYGRTDRYDRVSSTFRSNLGKLVRNWVEHRVGFSRLEEEHREKRNARYRNLEHPRLRVSPRASLGHDTYVGIKFRIAGTPSRLLSQMSFSTRQSFDSGATNLRLQWDDGVSRIALQHTVGHEIEGAVTELYGTWSF